MIDLLDLVYCCSPVLAVMWLAIYFNHRLERMARAQRLECERLVDVIRRIDPHAAARVETEVRPAPQPPLLTAALPAAVVVRGLP